MSEELVVLDPKLSAAITAAVAKGISEGVSEGVIVALQQTGNCSCNLEPEAAKEVGTLMDMVRGLGDGEHSQGIEKMRDHHKVMGAMLEGRRAFWCAVLKFAATAGAGFVAVAVWEHFTKVVK